MSFDLATTNSTNNRKYFSNHFNLFCVCSIRSAHYLLVAIGEPNDSTKTTTTTRNRHQIYKQRKGIVRARVLLPLLQRNAINKNHVSALSARYIGRYVFLFVQFFFCPRICGCEAQRASIIRHLQNEMSRNSFIVWLGAHLSADRSPTRRSFGNKQATIIPTPPADMQLFQTCSAPSCRRLAVYLDLLMNSFRF